MRTFSHKLLRAVGAEDRLVVDYSQGDLQVGDVFVLLSDGVHNVMPVKRLKKLSLDSAQALSEALVQAALGAGHAATTPPRWWCVCSAWTRRLAAGREPAMAQQLPIPSRLKVGDSHRRSHSRHRAGGRQRHQHPVPGARYQSPTLGTDVSSLPPEGALAPKGGLVGARGKPQAVRAQDPAPEPRITMPTSAPCSRTRPGWAKRMRPGRAAENLVRGASIRWRKRRVRFYLLL